MNLGTEANKQNYHKSTKTIYIFTYQRCLVQRLSEFGNEISDSIPYFFNILILWNSVSKTALSWLSLIMLFLFVMPIAIGFYGNFLL